MPIPSNPKILDLKIHGVIGVEINSAEIVAKLQNKYDAVMIDINSPGGSVFEGIAIYNALKAYNAPKHVKITGLCASIASVIAMSGSTIEMTKNSMMMIHLPTSSANGNSSDLRREAEVLDQLKENIKNAYLTRLNKDVNLDEMLEKQTWISPDEAKDIGLCDLITDTTPINKFFDLSQFNYRVPQEILNKFDVKTAKNEDEEEDEEELDEETFFNKLKKFIMGYSNKNKELPMPEEKKITEEKPWEKEIEDLKKNCSESEKKLNDITVENVALKAKVAEYESSKEALNKSNRIASHKQFVDKLVSEGKVLPTGVEVICNVLESVNADEKAFNDYKAMLEGLPPIVKMDGHIASKEKAAEFVDGLPVDIGTKAKELHETYKNSGIRKTYGDCLKEAARSK